MLELHQILELERPLIILDTETTGVNTAKDRIIELGFKQYEADGLKREWRSLIDPECDIPAAATKVHGITNAKVRACQKCFAGPDHCTCAEGFRRAPKWREIAPRLAMGFSNCDFAGSNVHFDLGIMSFEMVRANVRWSYGDAYVLDTHRLEQLIEPRTLSALFNRYTGEQLNKAHSALHDVAASMVVLAAQLTKYPNLPRTPRHLHELQWPGRIDPEGKFKMRDGVPCFGQWGKYSNQPMTAADPGYWKFIINSDFSEDVKALARNALAGRFPGDPQ